MKTIILTLFTFILVSSVWAEKPKESEQAADPKTTEFASLTEAELLLTMERT